VGLIPLLFVGAIVFLDLRTRQPRDPSTVSHEHINLIMDNDFKDLRERRHADEFLWMLHQSGARVHQG